MERKSTEELIEWLRGHKIEMYHEAAARLGELDAKVKAAPKTYTLADGAPIWITKDGYWSTRPLVHEDLEYLAKLMDNASNPYLTRKMAEKPN